MRKIFDRICAVSHKKIYGVVFSIGIVVCALLPTAMAVSEYIEFQRSPQAIYFDGRQIEMDAYIMDGCNYVKLRDIAEVVGFDVYWDGSAVQIISNIPSSDDETSLFPLVWKTISSAIGSVKDLKNGVYVYSDTISNVEGTKEMVDQHDEKCRFQRVDDKNWDWYSEFCDSGSEIESQTHWVSFINGEYQSNLNSESEYTIQIKTANMEGIEFIDSLVVEESEICSIQIDYTCEGMQYSFVYSADYLEKLKQKEISVLKEYQDKNPEMAEFIERQLEQLNQERYQGKVLTVTLNEKGILQKVVLEQVKTRSGITTKEKSYFEICEYNNSEFAIR